MSVTQAKPIAIQALQAYKSIVSPWFPASCRFSPTCSEYAVEAIQRYGLLGGFLRTLWRVLRCQPLHRGGFDPLT